MQSSVNKPLQKKLIVATRLHLGKASMPPQNLQQTVTGFLHFAFQEASAAVALIAVDATPKIDGYDLVHAIQTILDNNNNNNNNNNRVHLIPIMPWGNFVPALNALVSSAVREHGGDQILFVSAESKASATSIQSLLQQMTPETLVAGAVLSGHDYKGKGVECALGGRTSPWNTLAVWNLHKLSLTGFQLVSEVDNPNAGIEEVVAAALLQKILGPSQAVVKLVALSNDVEWQQDFSKLDPARQRWHEQKMQSKEQRATHQLLQTTSLQGSVLHC